MCALRVKTTLKSVLILPLSSCRVSCEVCGAYEAMCGQRRAASLQSPPTPDTILDRRERCGGVRGVPTRQQSRTPPPTPTNEVSVVPGSRRCRYLSGCVSEPRLHMADNGARS